jgi:hypothetical protein
VSIDLTTNPGGFFRRRASEVTEIDRIVTGFGDPLDAGTLSVFDQYLAAEQGVVSGLYAARDAFRQSYYTQVAALQGIATNGAVAQVNDAAPLPTQTISAALAAVISQMIATSVTLQRATTSAVVTPAATNDGDAVLSASLTGGDGDPLDLVTAESLTATVTADSGDGATAFAEPVQVVGEPAVAYQDVRWPAGSSTNRSLSFTDAAGTVSSSGQVLTNGSFQTWSGTGNNTPGTWALTGGAVAGTNVLRGSTSPLRAASLPYFMRFVSDGSTLTGISQAVTLSALTPYCLNLWARINTLDGSGTVIFKLTNGSGTTLTDAAGNSLTYTRNLNGQIGTSFTQVTQWFSTPALLPAGTQLVITFGVSPTAARTVDFALCALTPGTQLYAGGPYLAGFSKETLSVKGDYYTLAVANNLGRYSFVRSLDGIYGMRGLNLHFPTANSPTIPDSWITS